MASRRASSFLVGLGGVLMMSAVAHGAAAGKQLIGGEVAMHSAAEAVSQAPRWREPPPEPGLYATGDLALQPGMTLYIFRQGAAKKTVEVGRMKVLAVDGDDVKLELVSGSSAMVSGDRLEVEASSPNEWAPFPHAQ